MSDKKALWNRAFKTDPAAVKPITGKDYGGNSPKPYWIIERLTEEFGPCGIGWGYQIDSERFERFSETDTLHVAKVTLWYVMGGDRGEVTQMGQTKATYVTSKGQFKVDEDAPKKSVTDALVKCASYLGFAGDIFSGRWDDSKYVAGLRKEFAEGAPTPVQPPKNGAVADVLATLPKLSPQWEAYFNDKAAEVCEAFGANADAGAALQVIHAADLNNEERIQLDARLPSNVRSAIKREQEAAKARDAVAQ